MSYLLYGTFFLVVGLAVMWLRKRIRDYRESVQAREAMVLAAIQAAGKVAATGDDEGNVDAGLSTNLRGSRGIEVAEESIDIEALLSSVPPGSAARARAQLDEPTNIEPMLSGAWPSTGQHTGSPTTRTNAPTTSMNVAAPPVTKPPSSLELDVPLRNLVLAWYEARGYRPAPASTALRPIDVVLRHREDPSRSYAFVYEPGRSTGPRASSLLDLARSAGLTKLLVATEHGGDSALRANRVKGVRMIDWPSIESDLKKLDREVADRIVGIARQRSAPSTNRVAVAAR
jgi:hypothetical protein